MYKGTIYNSRIMIHTLHYSKYISYKDLEQAKGNNSKNMWLKPKAVMFHMTCVGLPKTSSDIVNKWETITDWFRNKTAVSLFENFVNSQYLFPISYFHLL